MACKLACKTSYATEDTSIGRVPGLQNMQVSLRGPTRDLPHFATEFLHRWHREVRIVSVDRVLGQALGRCLICAVVFGLSGPELLTGAELGRPGSVFL